MKNFRAPHIRFAGAVLSAAFFQGAFLVLMNGYEEYRLAVQGLKQMEVQVQSQQRISQAMTNYTETMDAVAGFLEKAQAAGVTDKAWQTFSVDIRESLTFAEAAMVLGQAQSKETYFFRPDSFRITRPEVEKKVAKLRKPHKEPEAPEQAAAPAVAASTAGGMAQNLQIALAQQAAIPQLGVQAQQGAPEQPAVMEARGDLRVMVTGAFLVRRK